MNRFILTALVATCAALANPSFADDITPTPDFVSTADRAQVATQFQQSRSMRDPASIAYNPLADFTSERTRQAVRAEYINSRDEVAELTGEDSGSFALGRGDQASTSVADSGGVARPE